MEIKGGCVCLLQTISGETELHSKEARSHRERRKNGGQRSPCLSPPTRTAPSSLTPVSTKWGATEIKGHVMKGALRGFGDSVVLLEA